MGPVRSITIRKVRSHQPNSRHNRHSYHHHRVPQQDDGENKCSTPWTPQIQADDGANNQIQDDRPSQGRGCGAGFAGSHPGALAAKTSSEGRLQATNGIDPRPLPNGLNIFPIRRVIEWAIGSSAISRAFRSLPC